MIRLLTKLLRAALLWLHLRNTAEYARQAKQLDDEITTLREKQASLRTSSGVRDQRLATALLVRLRQAETARSILTARFVEFGEGSPDPDPDGNLHPGEGRAMVRPVGGVGAGGGDAAPAHAPVEVRRALPAE